MKWMIMFLSFLIKRFTDKGGETIHPIEDIKDFLRENALKFLVGMIAVVAVGTMFTSGVVLTVMSLVAQYDLGLVPKLTATVAGGLGLILVSSLITSLALYLSNSHERHKIQSKKRHFKATQTGPMEDAIILLINDFVKEREANREAKREEAAYQTRRREQEEKEIHKSPNFRSSEEFERH